MKQCNNCYYYNEQLTINNKFAGCAKFGSPIYENFPDKCPEYTEVQLINQRTQEGK